MGEEISRTQFSREDYARFAGRLRAETALAEQYFNARRFSESGMPFMKKGNSKFS